jgi:hypothetical protein
MSRRDIITREFCIAASVAVVLAVMASPIRPVRNSERHSPSTFLLRNFALSSAGKMRLASSLPSAPSIHTDAVLGEPGEDEKEVARPAWPLPGFLPRPWERTLTSGLDAAGTATVPATHPLRC